MSSLAVHWLAPLGCDPHSGWTGPRSKFWANLRGLLFRFPCPKNESCGERPTYSSTCPSVAACLCFLCSAATSRVLNDFCCFRLALLRHGGLAALLHVPGEKPLATGGRRQRDETVQARGWIRSSAQRCLDMTSALFLNTLFFPIKLWTNLTTTDI